MLDDSRDQASMNKNNSSIGLLGGIPHTIRGSIWGHEMRLTITHRFPSCTACSYSVINEYKKRRFLFVLDACNQPNYLERLAGLEELLKSTDFDEVIILIIFKYFIFILIYFYLFYIFIWVIFRVVLVGFILHL